MSKTTCVSSIEFVAASKSRMMDESQPPAVMLLLMTQGEYPSRLDLFRFVLGLIGVYLFVELVGEVNWFGILLVPFNPIKQSR